MLFRPFDKSRRAPILIRVDSYRGQERIDLRRTWMNRQSKEWMPTYDGVNLTLGSVPALVNTIHKAIEMWRETGEEIELTVPCRKNTVVKFGRAGVNVIPLPYTKYEEIDLCSLHILHPGKVKHFKNDPEKLCRTVDGISVRYADVDRLIDAMRQEYAEFKGIAYQPQFQAVPA